jgi:hypothetical protein
MLPLIVKSKLFWRYQGQLESCWYLSYADREKQDSYISEMNRFGADTATLNLCNEDIGTCFTGEFMRSPIDERKVSRLVDFIGRLKSAGKNIVIVFFDCPPVDNAPFPFWKFMDRIPDFLEIATRALAPIVDGFILSIESNRHLSLDLVDAGIAHIQRFAMRGNIRLPVGTHEQSYRVPKSADFLGYETRNHPFQGHTVPIPTMVSEIDALVQKAVNKPVWVMEATEREDEGARELWNAIASRPGVVGVGGPL